LLPKSKTRIGLRKIIFDLLYIPIFTRFFLAKDKGTGVSGKVIDKIFQPFFTTKPTGEGTGLGFGLSYDIVKAHGGELKVENEEGEGPTFIIDIAIT
jgi:signal transduction histidine kinase